MEIVGLAVVLAFVIGLAIGFVASLGFLGPQNPKEFELKLMIQLDATQPIAIKAVGKDAEGNVVDLAGTDLVIEAIATEGEFGTVNDEQDTFNPGEAGAKGTLKGSVTVADVEYVAEVEIELVAGGLAEIDLEFSPAPPE